MTLNNISNMTLVDLQKITQDNSIIVAPKSTQTLYLRISAEQQGAFSYDSQSSYRIVTSYTDPQLIAMIVAKPTRVK